MITYRFPILTVHIKLQKDFRISHSNPVGRLVVSVIEGLNHTDLHNLHTCEISLGELKLTAPEAGDFMELVPLY